MDEERIEILGILGEMADSMDSVLAATELQLPCEMHKEQLTRKIGEWSKRLKELYQRCTKENPWSDAGIDV